MHIIQNEYMWRGNQKPTFVYKLYEQMGVGDGCQFEW